MTHWREEQERRLKTKSKKKQRHKARCYMKEWQEAHRSEGSGLKERGRRKKGHSGILAYLKAY
jgi:hypothetical protein